MSKSEQAKRRPRRRAIGVVHGGGASDRRILPPGPGHPPGALRKARRVDQLVIRAAADEEQHDGQERVEVEEGGHLGDVQTPSLLFAPSRERVVIKETDAPRSVDCDR